MHLKKTLYLAFCLLLFLRTVNADNLPAGAGSAGLAHASVARPGFWSIYNNQAGLAITERITAGIYIENKYLLKELTFKAFGLILPTGPGVFGLSLSQFGFHLYNENKVGIVYARMFFDKLSIGVELNYHHVSFTREYGKKSHVTFEIGILYNVTQKLKAGFHAFNPTAINQSSNPYSSVPAIFRFGFNYQVSRELMLLVEAENVLASQLSIKAGIEYNIANLISIRSGIAGRPFTCAFGVGLSIKKLRLDLASTYHHILGYSPQISLTFQF